MNSNILFFLGHPKYNLSQELEQKSNIIKCGKYTAKYNFYDVPFGYIPNEYANKWEYITEKDKPLYKWNIPICLKIYDDCENLIQTKTTSYTPCINFYGDGITLENTYFTILEIDDNNKPKFNIYDLTGKCIKSFTIMWHYLNFDIYITTFNNIIYAIIFHNYVISIIDMNKLNDCILNHNVDNIILPLMGQNKMYVIEIKNNQIIFNTGKICDINNIEYELSKFLLQGNSLYNINLVNNTKYYSGQDNKIKHFVHTCGIFSAEYDYKDHYSRFDSNIEKFPLGTKVIFKENGEKIFEMDSNSSPSIIIHGDGKTREGTRFCIGNVYIYDFNQKLIRKTQIGSDSHHDIQRVNDKYAISNSIEVCTWCNFFGLIDLDLFFSQNGNEEEIRAYDNARIYIPINRDDILYATCADENGFILNNGFILEYEKADDFDFSNNTGYNMIDLSKFGYEEEQIKKINEILLKGGTISIPISSDDKKMVS